MLINITGGHDLTLFELDEAANRIREEVDPDANIIVGSTLDAEMEGVMRVSVVATGIDAREDAGDIAGAAPLDGGTARPERAGRATRRDGRAGPRRAPRPPTPRRTRRRRGARPGATPLFAELDAQRAAAEDQMEDIFTEDQQPAKIGRRR